MTTRKTPPVQTQVINPLTQRIKPARFGKRLIDFDTGSAELEDQHRKWLMETMRIVKTNAQICVVVTGFASKLGNQEKNRALSCKRIMSVISFMQREDSRVLANAEMFWSGEDESEGSEFKDDPTTAVWRAVEVFVYMESCGRAGIREAIPPKWQRIPPREVQPLPGGNRYRDWSICSPGGGVGTFGIVAGGFNIFLIRNDTTKEERGYINPCGGGSVGLGIKIKGIAGLAKLIFDTILGSISVSIPSYTSVNRPSPDLVKPLGYDVTWKEMESCFVTVPAAGAGIVWSYITFHCPEVDHYGPSGNPMKSAKDLFTIRDKGFNLQASVGATGGPLIPIG